MSKALESLAQRLLNAGWHTPSDNIPDIIYHYTDAAGLVGILSAKAVWATEYRFMNDSSEINIGLRLSRTLLDIKISKEKDKDQKKLEFLKSLRKMVSSPISESNYIASFTDRRDDLSQWRGYANDGRGFTIGFDTRKIIEISKAYNSFSFGRVNYNNRLFLQSIDNIVKEFYDFFISSSSVTLQKLCTECDSVISSIAATYKHSSFKSEGEWRIHLYPDAAEIKVRSSGSNLKPYTVLDPQMKYSIDIPIREIGIGPAFKSDEYRYAVEKLLNQYEIKAEIYTANTPYRLL